MSGGCLKTDTSTLARHVRINVPSWSEQSGPDWNIACLGVMTMNEEFAIIEIHRTTDCET
jgi:hypothetical protein